jgi:hypothetical protein
MRVSRTFVSEQRRISSLPRRERPVQRHQNPPSRDRGNTHELAGKGESGERFPAFPAPHTIPAVRLDGFPDHLSHINRGSQTRKDVAHFLVRQRSCLCPRNAGAGVLNPSIRPRRTGVPVMTWRGLSGPRGEKERWSLEERRSAQMAYRHYGLREKKPPATDGGHCL